MKQIENAFNYRTAEHKANKMPFQFASGARFAIVRKVSKTLLITAHTLALSHTRKCAVEMYVPYDFVYLIIPGMQENEPTSERGSNFYNSLLQRHSHNLEMDTDAHMWLHMRTSHLIMHARQPVSRAGAFEMNIVVLQSCKLQLQLQFRLIL